ncbi:DUF2280 domain-containing protein [Acinetobacter indicus]|uniref:DUF2280 domain-containing protein n=1 Tax=Acinetobacter TaxID=469 RepID=UPI0013B074F3|nr:DUF2280 domain-containing protein [Acinetobacter indicus]QIC79079.1 DUF2280 domain-containing protein [Acinetobacter indicus]
MATLNQKHKLFIVRSLAQWNTPTETVELVQQEFGITISRQQCEAYDPTKRTGQNLSKVLADEFYKTREQFRKNTDEMPLANLAVRLRHYENLLNNPQNKRNPILQLTILKQVAEDVGGKYTNKTELTGAGGGPLQSENVTYVDASPELVKQVLDELESKY